MQNIDEHWNAYPDQWEVLLNKKKLSKEFVEDKIKEWTEGNSYIVSDGEDIFEGDSEKPWDKTKHFQKEDVEGILHITLSNGVYVNTENIAEECEKAGFKADESGCAGGKYDPCCDRQTDRRRI